MKKLQKGSVAPLLLVIFAVLAVGEGIYLYQSKIGTPIIEKQTEQTKSKTPIKNTTTPKKVTTTVQGIVAQISSISGPIKLNDGESGTWKVNASGQGPLNYGVIWGDEPEYKNSYGGMPLSSVSYSINSNFSHKYNKVSSEGTTWTPTFFVKDIKGNIVRKSVSVNVGFGAATDLNTIIVSSPSAGSSWYLGQAYKITWSGHFERGDEVFSINTLASNGASAAIATVSFAQASCVSGGVGQVSTCSYTWIPSSPSQSLRIQVVNNKNSSQVGTSGIFSISR